MSETESQQRIANAKLRIRNALQTLEQHIENSPKPDHSMKEKLDRVTRDVGRYVVDLERVLAKYGDNK